MPDNNTPVARVDLKTAVRYFAEVEKHIELNKPLPWILSVDAVKAAFMHYAAPEAQSFIRDGLLRVVNTVTVQSPSKLGINERQNVEDIIYVALCIAIKCMADVPSLLSVVARIFDAKIPFYFGTKLGYTFTHGFPLVRIQMARKFADLKGFAKIADLLQRSTLSWPGADVLLSVLGVMQIAEVAPSIDDAVRESLVHSTMEKLLNLPDELLKKESTESIGSLVQTMGVLYFALPGHVRHGSLPHPQRDEVYYHFWYRIVHKCITSSSLIIKLFGYDQLNDMLVDAKDKRPIAGSFVVENAGTSFINGLYVVNTKLNFDAVDCYQYVKAPEKDGDPLLTLFRCTMRNTKAKWWFISQADAEKPGTDKDIDYYLHHSLAEDEREPPMTNWLRSNSGMKILGQDPCPILRRGEPFIRHPGITKDMFMDQLLLRWSMPPDSSNVLGLLFHVPSMHREIISRSERFLTYLIEYQSLTLEHMSMIWKAVLGCHDMDIVEEIFAILTRILPLLPMELFNFILSNAILTLSSEDPQYSKIAVFAEKFSGDGFKSINLIGQADACHLLIEFAWAVYNHPAFSHYKNAHAILDLLSFCFTQSIGKAVALERMVEYKGYLQSYANADAVDEEAVGQTLNILYFIIDKLVVTPQIVQVVQNTEVTDTIIAEIFRFIRANRSISEENYAARLSLRLQVLCKYFSVSEGLIGSATWRGIAELYQYMLPQPKELEAFFFFLQALHKATAPAPAPPTVQTYPVQSVLPPLPPPPYSATSNSRHALSYHIFNEFLCNPAVDWAQVKEQAFDCFSVYFNDLEFYNTLFVAQQGSGGGVDAGVPPIKQGIITLWRIVLNIKDSAALKSAIDLLLTAYESFSDAKQAIFTPSEILNILFTQLEICLTCLNSEGPTSNERSVLYEAFLNSRIADAGEAMFLVSRAIGVLQAGIQKFAAVHSLSHLAGSSMGRITISVSYRRVSYYYSSVTNNNVLRTEKGSEGCVKIDVHPLHTLKLLKNKIIEAANLDSNTRIAFDLQTAVTDTMRVADLDLVDGSEVAVSYEISYSSHRTYDDYPYDDTSPAVLGSLLSEDYAKFDILLSLVAAVPDVSLQSRIWDVLMLVPTQSNLLDLVQNAYDAAESDVQQFGAGVGADVVQQHVVRSSKNRGTTWSNLLDNSLPARRAYILQIIDMMLSPAVELDILRTNAPNFAARFIATDGIESLISVLLSQETEGVIAHAGFGVLIHSLQFVLFNNEGSAAVLELSAEENHALLQRLLYAAHCGASSGQSSMVQNALIVIVHVMKACPLSGLLTGPYAKDLVKQVIRNSNQSVRRMALDFVVQLGAVDENIVSWLVDDIAALQPRDVHCTELFAACRALLRPSSDLSHLGTLLAGKLLSFPPTSPGEDKVVLAGYLELLTHVVSLRPSLLSTLPVLSNDLLDVICGRFLFQLPQGTSSAFVLCDSPSTRSAAFMLLSQYAAHSPGEYQVILSTLSSLVRDSARCLAFVFNLQISYDMKSPQISHTGLKNQGCTCYLNSLLQVLYAFPAFRDNILSVPVKGIHRNTLWHIPPLDLVGKFVLLEHSNNMATASAVEWVRLFDSNWRLGRCIGYDVDSGYHRIQYYASNPFGLDEVALLSIHSGRHGKETGRVKLVPSEISDTRGVDGSEAHIASIIDMFNQNAEKIFGAVNEREEAALRVLEQLQRAFVFLKYTKRKYYDPKPLVEACKSLNLNYNIYHQNDAAEFYDQLIDRLETATKNLNMLPRNVWAEDFMQGVFGGKYITQKIPADCERFKANKADCGHFQSSRREDFLKVELIIRNKDNIFDSLGEMIAGELMDGENKISCDVCQEKKTTTRLTCLDSLPHMLLLHLKRFDLDFNTFETIKLNNRMAFPMNLNMFKYTKEGIDEEQRAKDTEGSKQATAEAVEGALTAADCEYELQGVLVHSGIAQGGHYYSFVKAVDEGPAGTTNCRWYRFDDEDVTFFDPDHIPFHCFGGSSGGGTSSGHGDDDRTANALMLLYAKTKTKDSAPPIVQQQGDYISGEQAFIREVSDANLSHLLSCYMVDPEMLMFFTQLLRTLGRSNDPRWTAEGDMALQTVQLAVSYLLDVLLHIRERASLRALLAALKECFVAYPHTARWFLCGLLMGTEHKGAGWMTDYVVHCTDPLARGVFVHLLVDAVSAFAHKDAKVKHHRTVDLRREAAEGCDEALLGLLVGKVADLALHAVSHTRTADEVFMLIRDLSAFPALLQAFQSIGMVSILVFYITPEGVQPQLAHAIEKTLTRPLQRDSLLHLAQSVFDAIAALVGVPQVRKVGLLQEKSYWDAELVPEAKEAFAIIFDESCRGGVMDGFDFAHYLDKVTAAMGPLSGSSGSGATGPTKSNSIPVRNVMDRFALHSDGKLRLEGFLQHQAETASYAPRTVWRDLTAFGFRNDLTRSKPSVLNPPPAEALVLPEHCRVALSQLSFYEAGLLSAESAARAIAQRIAACDERASHVLITQALDKLHQVSSESSWASPAVTVIVDFLRLLLSIEDEFSVRRLHTTLLAPQTGLAVVALQERAMPSQCRANEYTKHSMLERYVNSVQDLLTVPGLLDKLTHLATHDLQIAALRGMLKLRGSTLTEDEEMLVRNAVVRVEGAGTAHVNGDYTFDQIKQSAGCYSRNIANPNTGAMTRYTLYKCSLQNGGYQWFLSITPQGAEPGTKQDVDFYFATAKASDRLPPPAGWMKISGSARNAHNIAKDPAPRMTLLQVDGGPQMRILDGVVLNSAHVDDDDDDLMDGGGGGLDDSLDCYPDTPGLFPNSADSSDDEDVNAMVGDMHIL